MRDKESRGLTLYMYLNIALFYEGEDATTTTSSILEDVPKTYVSVPVMSLYNLMVIYLFLPIPRKDVALAAGLAVSAICLAMYAALSAAEVSTG